MSWDVLTEGLTQVAAERSTYPRKCVLRYARNGGPRCENWLFALGLLARIPYPAAVDVLPVLCFGPWGVAAHRPV